MRERLKDLRGRFTVDRLTTVGEVAGGSLVAVGFGLFALPLGLIVGGVELIGLSYLAAGAHSGESGSEAGQ